MFYESNNMLREGFPFVNSFSETSEKWLYALLPGAFESPGGLDEIFLKGYQVYEKDPLLLQNLGNFSWQVWKDLVYEKESKRQG